MDTKNRRISKKRHLSMKTVDYYFERLKKNVKNHLSSFANVITDCLVPYDSGMKKNLKVKADYIKNALFHLCISFALGLSGSAETGFPFGISTLFSFTSQNFYIFTFMGTMLSGAFTGNAAPIRLTVYLLIFLLRKTFTNGKFNEKLKFRMLCSGAFSLFIALSSLFGTSLAPTQIFLIIFNCVIGFCSVYFFHAFYSGYDKSISGSLYNMSLYAIFACTIPAFRLINFYDIDFSLIYAAILVLFFSKIKGPVYGCVAGFIFGFLCTNPLYCAPLGTAGLISGYLFTKSFIISSISFVASGLFCALYLFGFSCLSDFFPFIFTSSLIFMVIGTNTPKIFSPVVAKQQVPSKHVPSQSNNTSFGAVCDSLSGLSSILYKFAEHLKSPSHAETADIFDNAFNEICSRCSMNNMCYAKRECSLDKVRENVIEILRSDVLAEDKLSGLLLHKCIKSSELCDYINRHYAELRFVTMKANRTGTVACLYNSMSHLIRTTEKEEWAKNTTDQRMEKLICDALTKIGVEFSYVLCTGTRTKNISVYGIRADKIPCSSKDLSMYLSKQCHYPLTEPSFDICENANMVMKLSRREIIGCEYAQCTSSKENEDVNGDTVAFFDNDAGYFYSIISDGMGSGKSAAATSRLTCVFLEKLLKAGTKKNVCLELLNNLLLSKNDETFSSVDLLEIDKLNSSAYFIKAGAASSFILRGMKLYKIRSETPPVGIIHSFSAESTSFSLEKGDIIIMLSDGVTGNEKDEKWLSELIRIDTKDEPALLASSLIARAKEISGTNDDMSAVVIRII
ncbi:MAG: SpoIIE family protein phosphatase [Clostridia bacterium]|nr:SpoIIE family protein phosphatase [Clostridia bacterium]